MTKTRFNFPMK